MRHIDPRIWLILLLVLGTVLLIYTALDNHSATQCAQPDPPESTLTRTC